MLLHVTIYLCSYIQTGMEHTDVVGMLTRLKRNRAINEEENRKKRKIIVSTIIYVIVIVMHWYSKSVLLKEPSND